MQAPKIHSIKSRCKECSREYLAIKDKEPVNICHRCRDLFYYEHFGQWIKNYRKARILKAHENPYRSNK